MRRYGIPFLLLLALLMPLFMQASQQPKRYVYNTRNGLQSNVVYYIYRATNGLLYIAHGKGLSSFDGRNFLNYPNTRFPFQEVTNIMETRNGDIFCKTFNNALYRLSSRGTLEHKAIWPSAVGFVPATVFGDTIYGMSDDSLALFDARTGVTYKTPASPAPAAWSGKAKYTGTYRHAGSLYSVVLDDYGRLLELPRSAKETGVVHFSNGYVFRVPQKDPGRIFCVNTGEVFPITARPQAVVNSICCSDSVAWVCTSDGLYYRRLADRYGAFRHMLGGSNTSSVAELGPQSIIAGTLDKGLIYVPNFDVEIYTGLPDDISCITSYAHDVLLGTKSGDVLALNTVTDVVRPLATMPQQVSYLLKDASTLVAEGNGVVNNGQRLASVKDHTTVPGGYIFATSAGLYFLRQSQPQPWLQHLLLPPITGAWYPLSISNEHCSSVKYDGSSGRLYINNYAGLFVLDTAASQVRKMPEPDCVLKDMAIYNGQLYLATKDKGLLVFTGTTYTPAPMAGAVKGLLYKLLVCNNELWILGEDALYCLSQGRVHTYDHSIGLNASGITSFRVDSADVYVLEDGSLVRFHKNIISDRPGHAGFILHYATLGDSALYSGDRVLVSQDRVRIVYSFVTLGKPGSSYAAYSINVGNLVPLPVNGSVLDLGQMPPGRYTIDFYIVGDGNGKPVHSFSFVIMPHFYSTIWFFALLMVLLGVVVYIYNKGRIRKIKAGYELKQAKLLLEKELDKSMLTSIRAQMNPHFLFNALNTIQSYVYMNDKKNAGIYISKFSDLTRRILDHSSKELVTLAEELSALTLYLELEQMRFDGALDYHIQVHEQINTGTQLLPPMLLQPYVENAVKHGLFHKKQHRRLDIRILPIGTGIRIEIEDNGIGRKTSAGLAAQRYRSHQPFSMNANRKRLEILKQYQPGIQLEIVDKYSDVQQPLGTLVIIQLPG